MIVETREWARYHDDGTVEITAIPLPDLAVTAELPMPDVSDDERVAQLECERRRLTLGGWYIVSARQVRNKALDPPGQKTTIRMVFRPCRNQIEASQVVELIKQALEQTNGR